jgi:exopolyphosphatase/guanosine-5'-triphosphate,3'-diphosphate pyrophosphatase
MIRASIDLGTNTCLLLVIDGDRVLHDESRVVRLGQDVAKAGRLHPEAMERTRHCLRDYAQIASRLGVAAGSILAVATAQARDAADAQPFFNDLEQQLGLRFRILSGQEEARATFLGAAVAGSDPARIAVMDIGGGSTELVAHTGMRPIRELQLEGESLPIGAVKITEKFLHSDPVTDAEFWAAEDAIDRELLKMKPWREGIEMVGGPEFTAVAGTAVTLAMLQMGLTEFKASDIDGFLITRGDAHRLVEELKWRTVEERKAMPGMEPKRADVILAGALIFWRAMEVLDFPVARISTRGLRYGVFSLENP